MKIKIFQIDAFADRLFTGNPAAVCPLDSWLDDQLMQAIAAENNLAETAFVVPDENGFAIRWFTPEVEVDLCGHATLAAGYALWNHCNVQATEIVFRTLNRGSLTVRSEGQRYVLNFPTDEISATEMSSELLAAINAPPAESFRGKSDWMLVYESEQQIRSLKPDFGLLKQIEERGLIVTAPGDDCDFVSRFFAPKVGIDEDPVTGSAHTTLTPFWSNRLEKPQLVAKQLSKRGGTLYCEDLGQRVEIGGAAQTYLIGEIDV